MFSAISSTFRCTEFRLFPVSRTAQIVWHITWGRVIARYSLVIIVYIVVTYIVVTTWGFNIAREGQYSTGGMSLFRQDLL